MARTYNEAERFSFNAFDAAVLYNTGMGFRLVSLLVVLVIVYLLFGQMLSKKTAENSNEAIPVDTGNHKISNDPLKRPLDQTRAVLDKVRQNANEQP